MNVPVDFWGQVIDQDNQPLAGVEVEGRALQWRLVPPVSVAGHHVTNHVVSDVAGRFEFRNLNGSSFTLDLTKQGYQLEPQGGGKLGVSYSNPGEERPNFDHPFIYKMWKLRGAEPTLKMDKDRRILCDGTPVFANLATGEIVLQQIPGLHLKVVVLRTPVFRSVGDEGKYDWQATVEVLGGGLQPSEDPFMYQAPVDGYQPRWQVAYLKDSPDWKDERVEKFFVRTREGNYARIQLKFLAWGDENRIGFSIVSVLNPAGSRNLEDGPLKQ